VDAQALPAERALAVEARPIVVKLGGSVVHPGEHATEERLEIMADADGVWRCRTIFNCVEACPRGINITRAIMEVTRQIESRPG